MTRRECSTSSAVGENNDMRQGLEARVGVDQLHWSHIPVHAEVLQEIVQMVAASPDNEPTKQSTQQIENPKATLALLRRVPFAHALPEPQALVQETTQTS